MHQMFKTAFGDNAMGRTQTFECFFISNVGKIRLKIVSIQVIPPEVTQTKCEED
jgi:hypothetical protein